MVNVAELSIDDLLSHLYSIQKKIDKNTAYKLSEVEVREVVAIVRDRCPQKELALEPYTPGQTWGVRVLRIIQQPPGMSPDVEEILGVSSCELPDKYSKDIRVFWPTINTEANIAALRYAQRPELRDPQFYDY